MEGHTLTVAHSPRGNVDLSDAITSTSTSSSNSSNTSVGSAAGRLNSPSLSHSQQQQQQQQQQPACFLPSSTLPMPLSLPLLDAHSHSLAAAAPRNTESFASTHSVSSSASPSIETSVAVSLLESDNTCISPSSTYSTLDRSYDFSFDSITFDFDFLSKTPFLASQSSLADSPDPRPTTAPSSLSTLSFSEPTSTTSTSAATPTSVSADSLTASTAPENPSSVPSFSIDLDVNISSFDSDPDFEHNLSLGIDSTTPSTNVLEPRINPAQNIAHFSSLGPSQPGGTDNQQSISSTATSSTESLRSDGGSSTDNTSDTTNTTSTQQDGKDKNSNSRDDHNDDVAGPKPLCLEPSISSTLLPMRVRQRSSTVERPRSWLSSSKSAISVRELLGDKTASDAWHSSGGRLSSRGSIRLKRSDSLVQAPAPNESDIESSTTDANQKSTSTKLKPIPIPGQVASVPASAVSNGAGGPDDGASDASDRPSRRKMFGLFSQRGSQFSDSRSPSPRRVLSREHTAIHSQSAPNLPSLRNSSSISRLRSPARSVTSSTTSSSSSNANSYDGKTGKINRGGSFLSRMKRPGGVFRLNNQLDNSDTTSSTLYAPSLGPLVSSNATAGSTTSQSASISEKSNVTVTDDSSFEMLPTPQPDVLRRAFDDINSAAERFESKTIQQRMQIVRLQVLPFVQRHGNDTSHKVLSNTDLESRATILDRWWVLLMNLLDGTNNQPIAGVDRLPLAEALTLIMMRPEWRQTTSFMTSLQERQASGKHMRGRSWTNASDSTTMSELDIADMSEHNIRLMFVRNLARQVEIVADKMSQRHTSLGVTNFCGKALAYAFFFVPGAAEMLVRLWQPKVGLMQRVADSFGLPRFFKDSENEAIVSQFPPLLKNLAWTGVKSTSRLLKMPPKVQSNLTKVQWRGPWVNRWQGRDTDILFIFVKYYHVLAQEFLPENLPLSQRARAPGFILVHSQLLAILDATINRHAVLEAFNAGPTDVSGTDAFSTTMPFGGGPGDLMKGMSENRSLKLLKDFLSESGPVFAQAKRGFGEAFAALMKATASTTSQFNQSACITLCDFLEEALPIFDGHEEIGNELTSYLDWDFWMKAMCLMLSSMNTMTEIRVLCLVHTVWEVLARSSERKKQFCLGWLLIEELFDCFFNHWCPMVRAYYMRLLCWRICRDTGSATEVDAEIFLVVTERLKKCWRHYLWLQQQAEENCTQKPNSAPCHPAPGKKFMIIRTEVHVAQNSLMMGFDSVGRIPQPVEAPITLAAPSDPFASKETTSNNSSPTKDKKKWSLFSLGKSLLGGDNSEDDFTASFPANNTTRIRTPSPTKGHATHPSDASSTGSAPLFDAQKYIFRFLLNWHPQACAPAQEILIVRPRLPAPAHAVAMRKMGEAEEPPMSPGLISEARNPPKTPPSHVQSEVEIEIEEPTPTQATVGEAVAPPERQGDEDTESFHSAASEMSGTKSSTRVPMVIKPAPLGALKPDAFSAQRVIYSGRALAEWTMVVIECNNFVERRRDEGVSCLADVEVPTLMLEPVRRPS